MPLAHFSTTVFAVRALAVANGQLGIANRVNCPAMRAVKTIAMAESPSSMHASRAPSRVHKRIRSYIARTVVEPFELLRPPGDPAALQFLGVTAASLKK